MTEILVGGAITIAMSLIAYGLGSKKTKAETDKIDAETEKTEAETERIKIESSAEKLDLINNLMKKIDAMQQQMDIMQDTINTLKYNQCIEDICPINIEYKKILEKRKNRKKPTPKVKE